MVLESVFGVSEFSRYHVLLPHIFDKYVMYSLTFIQDIKHPPPLLIWQEYVMTIFHVIYEKQARGHDTTKSLIPRKLANPPYMFLSVWVVAAGTALWQYRFECVWVVTDVTAYDQNRNGHVKAVIVLSQHMFKGASLGGYMFPTCSSLKIWGNVPLFPEINYFMFPCSLW